MEKYIYDIAMGSKQHYAELVGIENGKNSQKVVGGTFEPCWKCDYLFNHTSGKVSRGTGVEDPCVIKIKYWNSVRAVMDQ